MPELRSRQTGAAHIKKLVLAALFSALAYVATILTAWIRVSGFLTFDAKDTLITVAGLVLGPVYSILISLLVSLIEIITIPETGFWGFLMNFLSTAAFAGVCSLIYKYKKNLKGACIGLVSSVFATTAVMALLNLFVTPIYTGLPTETIAKMIPTLFLPFNFTKAVLNSALVLIIYKPVSRALKATKMMPDTSSASASDTAGDTSAKRRKMLLNLAVTGTGLLLVAISVFVLIFVLDGSFSFK